MKIYKWVPVTSGDPKKSLKHRENKENLTRKNAVDSSNSNSNFSLAEDSNTCKYLEFVSNRYWMSYFYLWLQVFPPLVIRKDPPIFLHLT